MPMTNISPQADTHRRPDLFLVGAPKAGTTSLHAYLSEHPDVFMSGRKEPFYFAPDIPYPIRRNRFDYGKDEERYLTLFEGATTETCVGESSTHYMSSHVAPGLIREFQPDARIVCILRDPVYVAYAWHGERLFRGVESNRGFDLALLDRPAGALYLEVGRYGSQLKRWFDHFGRERVHPIVFDDFVADTPGEFRRLLEFLGVDPAFQPRSFVVHNPATAKSRLVPRLRTRPVRITADALRRMAGKRMTRGLSRGLRNLPVLNRSGARPAMPDEVRRRLQEAYEEEVELAGQLLNRDLRGLWWSRADHEPVAR
ncbi:MAG: sulfotransferase family protein [Gaiellaceae bacterium]